MSMDVYDDKPRPDYWLFADCACGWHGLKDDVFCCEACDAFMCRECAYDSQKIDGDVRCSTCRKLDKEEERMAYDKDVQMLADCIIEDIESTPIGDLGHGLDGRFLPNEGKLLERLAAWKSELVAETKEIVLEAVRAAYIGSAK